MHIPLGKRLTGIPATWSGEIRWGITAVSGKERNCLTVNLGIEATITNVASRELKVTLTMALEGLLRLIAM
jgi:hypothetical protein